MSAQDILSALPRLSVEERESISKVLREMAVSPALPSDGPRKAGLHAGAWDVAADFDAPLPDGFWVGDDA